MSAPTTEATAQKNTTNTPPQEQAAAGFDWLLIKRFVSFLSPYRFDVTLGIAFIPFSVLFSVLYPWLIMRIIDEQLVPAKFDGLWLWIALLLGVLVANYISDAIYNYSLQKASQKAILDLRKVMFSRVLYFPRRYFDKTPLGVTLTRLTSDLEAINETFAQGFLSMVRDLLTTLALLIFLATISWRLTLVLLLVGPLIYYITEKLRRLMRDAFVKSRQVLSQGTGYLQECLNGIKTVQLYAAETAVHKQYQHFTSTFEKAQGRSNFFDSALYSLIEGVTTVSLGLIIWYGAGEVLTATITVGVLIGFINSLDKIFVPIRDFTSQLASIQRALAAMQHIEEVFAQPLEEQVTTTEPAIDARLNTFESLVFDDVWFRYNDDGPQVLKGISFTLNKGEKIALVGTTGSGKSTILRLLTKTYDNYQGSITLNGIELTTIPKATVRKFFSLMQQEVFLFNDSIAFNIGLGRAGITDADIVAAANYVYANEFIEQLPGAYQFQCRDNGGNLSVGQSQLIAFARAIAGGSEVVMLDEATSAVDSVTEQLIKRAIDHVFMEKSVIAIAHRLSTIQHSDQILVLTNGIIKERGTHQSLVAADGIYADLLLTAI
ncbi:ABC transporter ATP-binding protein [Oceanicoccus sp. KOV_DT_Chl]|uniref:ABC transporter ATP-binding protein n=1 Tax=Oceanicoccus sp. KOV_DT_Chl TaxID=1904639 RepID=UPI000C79C076|nr:ABC transporter ATP-binding protein [Oceanicoccus sp. KOV_DT_Chl]